MPKMPKIKARMVAGKSVDSILDQLPPLFRPYAEALYNVLGESGDSAAVLLVMHKGHIQVTTAAMVNPVESEQDRITSTMIAAEVARKMQGVFTETVKELAEANEEGSGH